MIYIFLAVIIILLVLCLIIGAYSAARIIYLLKTGEYPNGKRAEKQLEKDVKNLFSYNGENQFNGST